MDALRDDLPDATLLVWGQSNDTRRELAREARALGPPPLESSTTPKYHVGFQEVTSGAGGLPTCMWG